MDRRKFLKGAALAAIAGASASCTDYAYIPFVPGRHHRPPKDKDEDWTSRKDTSLFVAVDRHEMGKGNNLPALLQKAANLDEVVLGVVLLGGDYVGGGGNMTPEFSINDLYDEVYSAFDFPACEALFTYGSHDNCCTEGYSAFFSGPHRCDGYYIYGVSYVQMACATDSDASAAVALHNGLLQSGSQFEEFEDDDIILTKSGYSGIDIADRYGKSADSASKNFLKWVDSLDDDAPIVVMSHMPMHANRGDNFGGLIWFEALSKAAEKHDILFLWGHNHTLEEKATDPTDREDSRLKDKFHYLLTPADLLTSGDKMDVQGAVKEEVVSKELTFCYANAGYIKLGYGMTITFSDSDSSGSFDKMTLLRFGIDSVAQETEIGFTGKANPYTIKLKKTSPQSSGRTR